MSYEPTIAVQNWSSVVSDGDVQAACIALQGQVAYDFKPHWDVGCRLEFVARDQTPSATAWQLQVLDDSDQAGALGYHDLTASGLPLAKVFAKTDQQYGYQWTITASHELLEMLGDPWIDSCVQVAGSTFYALEVADAPEADANGYLKSGIVVSDFVYPNWFRAGSHGPYDHQGRITRPLELLPGGYIGEYICGQGWSQKTAETGTAPASRRLEQRQRKHSGGTFARSTR